MDNPISAILENAAQQIVVTVSDVMVQTVAAVTIAQQVEQITRLEQSAQQLESEGKTEIAAVLRARVAQLSALTPSPNQTSFNSHSWTSAVNAIAGRQPSDACASDMDDRPNRRRRRTAQRSPLLATLELDTAPDTTLDSAEAPRP